MCFSIIRRVKVAIMMDEETPLGFGWRYVGSELVWFDNPAPKIPWYRIVLWRLYHWKPWRREKPIQIPPMSEENRKTIAPLIAEMMESELRGLERLCRPGVTFSQEQKDAIQ